jgi:DNA polymerase-3 subunit beta
MKFNISRNDFYKTLQKVINVIPSKSTSDILYNVLLIVENGRLQIVATDLEITQVAWVNCAVEEDGAIVLLGKLLADIIREMPEINLTFTADVNHKVIIESKIGEYKLSGQSRNEFPSVPIVESEQTISLENKQLKRMIEKTLFACSTDTLRPGLTGVYSQIMETEFRMVSTDGHRLAKIINENFSSPGFTLNLIIPSKALNFVGRNLPEKGSQKITFSQNHILFELPDTNIYSRIIEDPYPDYERVIPVELNKEIVVNKTDFMASVKRVSLFSNPITAQIRLSVTRDKMVIYAQDIDFGGEANEELSCKYDSDDTLEIAYNANFLLDILRHLDTDDVHIRLEDADGPGLIFPDKQQEKENLLMLLMPIRLNN